MVSIVTVNETIDKEEDIAAVVELLVHEAVHVFQNICDHIGEKSPSSEMEAYAIGYISKKLVDAYCATGRFKIEKEKPAALRRWYQSLFGRKEK